MQPVSELPDLSLNNARSAAHRGDVENCGTRCYLLNCCRALVRMIPEVLHPVPVSIVPCRHRLADASSAVAEADVAIAFARVAEFREPAVFEGFDYRRPHVSRERRAACGQPARSHLARSLLADESTGMCCCTP